MQRGAGGGYQGGCGCCFWKKLTLCVCVFALTLTSVFNILRPSLFQVYLEARKQEQQKHQESLKMLSDEVSQIQEVSQHKHINRVVI